jgi:outer membrane protein insertion porin family
MNTLALAMALTLLGASSSAQQPAQAGPALRVERVIFVGNRVFSDEELNEQLPLTGETGWLTIITGRNLYTRERFQADAARLQQFLADRGYLRAVINEPRIELINPADAARSSGEVPIHLVIPISEGPLHRLNRLEIRGGRICSAEAVRAQFQIRAGEVLRAYLIEEGVTRLRQLYGRRGYLQFTPTLDFKFAPGPGGESLTDLTLTLNEGGLYTLGRLEFTGRLRTREAVLRQMIPLDEGEVFNYARLAQGLERLGRTGLFDPIQPNDVSLSFAPAQGTANAELRLTERDRQRIDFNAGGGTVGGATVGLDYANINLTGRADTFAAQLRLGQRERSVAGQYAITALTRPPLTLSFAGFYQRLEFVNARTPERDRQPLFIQSAAGLSAGFSLPLTSSRYALGAPTRAGLRYSFNSTALRDVIAAPAGTMSELEQSGIRTASLTPLLVHDTLDRELDPRRGLRLALAMKLSARALGGSLSTVKPSVDFRQFIPLGPKRDEPRVLGLRVRAAHIAGFGEPFQARTLALVDGVAIFNRFFLGGEAEVRGYDVSSIAPLARVERFLVIGL